MLPNFKKSQIENLVDFEKFCKTHIFLQKSEPIQPKTSNICRNFANRRSLTSPPRTASDRGVAHTKSSAPRISRRRPAPMFFLTFIRTVGYFLANFERLVLGCMKKRRKSSLGLQKERKLRCLRETKMFA